MFDNMSDGSDLEINVVTTANFPGPQNGVRRSQRRKSSSSSTSSNMNSPESAKRKGVGLVGGTLPGSLLAGVMDGDFIPETAEMKKVSASSIVCISDLHFVLHSKLVVHCTMCSLKFPGQTEFGDETMYCIM